MPRKKIYKCKSPGKWQRLKKWQRLQNGEITPDGKLHLTPSAYAIVDLLNKNMDTPLTTTRIGMSVDINQSATWASLQLIAKLGLPIEQCVAGIAHWRLRKPVDMDTLHAYSPYPKNRPPVAHPSLSLNAKLLPGNKPKLTNPNNIQHEGYMLRCWTVFEPRGKDEMALCSDPKAKTISSVSLTAMSIAGWLVPVSDVQTMYRRMLSDVELA
jgi:hypothetical protein